MIVGQIDKHFYLKWDFKWGIWIFGKFFVGGNWDKQLLAPPPSIQPISQICPHKYSHRYTHRYSHISHRNIPTNTPIGIPTDTPHIYLIDMTPFHRYAPTNIPTSFPR